MAESLPSQASLLSMRGIDKRFNGVPALLAASLEAGRSEIHALSGQNGAGKSTMIKILTGYYSRDAGEILFDGAPLHVDSPKSAQRSGISTIYQEINLVSYRSVTENTLAIMLAARGIALLLANNQSVSVSYDTDFAQVGQGDFLGFPIPAWITLLLFGIGSVLLNLTSCGRYSLAIGGNADASRLMGLPVDRITFSLYLLSGLLSGLAGVLLVAQFGAGQPTEGVGWELFAIASVVVGGTLLTRGQGSVITTLAGVLLLGLILNILNVENGLGWISLSAYWQPVVRGVFLMLVVMFESKLVFARSPAMRINSPLFPGRKQHGRAC